MANHFEVPFETSGIIKNATVQLDRNGAYVTMEDFVRKWNEVQNEGI